VNLLQARRPKSFGNPVPKWIANQMLLIGSKALEFSGPFFLAEGVKRSWDNDYISTIEEYETFAKTIEKPVAILPLNRGKTIAVKNKAGISEFEIAWPDSTAKELLSILGEDIATNLHNNFWIAKPNLIFTLKKSHRFLRNSPHFMKTMLDYKHLRDVCKCTVPERLKDWAKKREAETYWYKHPSLDVKKDDFFVDNFYEYDHDTIHQAVAHQGKPAYEYYKEPGQEVKCSKSLFFDLPEHYRLNGVLEEAYVLALERSQIPHKGAWTPKQSFEYALMKVASSITSGWFREYAYENYFKVLDLYDDTYVDRFWKAVDKGIVKKIVK
jgi:hypothetical protein